MRAPKWRGVMCAVAATLMMGFVAGCSGFWDPPTSSSAFTLSNSGNISVAPGATSDNTSTIKVTPSSSFTGTVTLACSVTSSPSGATSPFTCSLSPTSVTFSSSATSSSAAQTSTLTATTTSSTTTGTYNIAVTGTSGGASQTTTLCAEITTSSATCTATNGNSSSNFYVLNQQTNQIAAFSISSGSLGTIVGSPYSLLSAPLSIAIAPSGSFLYVGTATGIFLYSIGSNGQLTLANNGSVISQDIATAMQVDVSGQWLLEAGPNFTQLSGIRINPSTGVPASTTAQAIILPAATIQQIAISSDNTRAFVALGSSGTQSITFNSNSLGSPFVSSLNIPTLTVAGAALSVAVDPAGRLLYIGETAARSGTTNTGGMRVFNYSSLTELTGSPFASGGLSPVVILPLPYGTNKGNYVYVANRAVSGSTTGLIQGFFVTTSGTTNSVSAMTTSTPTGNLPAGMVQDGTGNYLLVVNSGGNPDLQAFTFDTTTAGKLNSAFTSATGTDPVLASAIAAAP